MSPGMTTTNSTLIPGSTVSIDVVPDDSTYEVVSLAHGTAILMSADGRRGIYPVDGLTPQLPAGPHA